MTDRSDQESTTPAEATWSPLDPAWIPCERVARTIDAIVWIGLLAFLLFGGPELFGWHYLGLEPWLRVLWIVFGCLILTRAWLWPPVAYRHIRWRQTEVGIEIRRGVFWRRWITVPRSRVQHTDVSEGPMLRRYGLARITVYTAGTEFAEIALAGIEQGQAFALRDALIGRPTTIAPESGRTE
ncbi:MAG: PH domain-containing protein [Planctomycetes bacterium]|nr:PH domain-containing protein [Planctomycetota bacterium]MCB9917237.1 PH domain-containing protein [Planctomycetota bacterium]